MPAKLVNTVRVAPAGVFLVQAVAAQVVDGGRLVDGRRHRHVDCRRIRVRVPGKSQ